MKSKNYILSQIKELLQTNRGYYDTDAEEFVESLKSKTVYELLVIKKELSQTKEFPDVSCMRWYREEEQYEGKYV
jgi:hypothetical protein